MNVVNSDLDDDVLTFDSVQCTQDTADTNTIVLITPSATRFVCAPTKVKIKLTKIMRDHNIPLVTERELYKWAIESKSLPGFTWSTDNWCLIHQETQQKVLEQC